MQISIEEDKDLLILWGIGICEGVAANTHGGYTARADGPGDLVRDNVCWVSQPKVGERSLSRRDAWVRKQRQAFALKE